MSDFTFSVVTAIFTIGGLIGSLFANYIMDLHGRLRAARVSAILFGLGAFIMSASSTVPTLALGR